VAESPLGRGKGRQALGWVVESSRDPPLRFAPPPRGGDSFGNMTELESDRGEIACKEDICRTIGREGSG